MTLNKNNFNNNLDTDAYSIFISQGCDYCDPYIQFNERNKTAPINEIIILNENEISFICNICKTSCFKLKNQSSDQRIYFRISSKNIDFCFFSYSEYSFTSNLSYCFKSANFKHNTSIKTKIEIHTITNDIIKGSFIKEIQIDSFENLVDYLKNFNDHYKQINKLLFLL